MSGYCRRIDVQVIFTAIRYKQSEWVTSTVNREVVGSNPISSLKPGMV